MAAAMRHNGEAGECAFGTSRDGRMTAVPGVLRHRVRGPERLPAGAPVAHLCRCVRNFPFESVMSNVLT